MPTTQIQNTNTPKLRFPGFSGGWEEKKLGDEASFLKGRGISKDDTVEDGTLECIRYGELYTKYGETIKNIYSKTNVEADTLILSEANDVIIPASGETQLDIATASCVLNSNIALGGDLNIIRSKNNGVFLSYYLNSAKKFDIARLSQGVSVVHLYSSQLKTLKLNLPSLPEQEKIASFLTTVNEKIDKIREKKELLDVYKKGVMQKIFSQEIRFPGFDDDWEEKKILNIFEITRGNVLSMTKIKLKKEDDFIYPVYSSQTKDNGLAGYYDEFLYENAITWTTDGANAGEVNYRDGKFYCTNVCGVLLSEDGYANLCIAEILNSVSKKYVSYVGNPKLMNNVMGNIKIKLPSLPEQEKIASFFSAIDEKIEKIDSELEGVVEWKKGLLQGLFV